MRNGEILTKLYEERTAGDNGERALAEGGSNENAHK